MSEYSIPQDITIDINKLEEESVNLLSESYTVGLDMAELNAEVDEAKKEMERVEAEVETDYRQYWDKYFTDIKFSEGAVKKQVLLNDKYIKAQDHYFDVKKKRGKFGVYDSTLTRKEKVIENLVKLWSSNYFKKYNTPEAVKDIQNAENKKEARKQLSNNKRLKNRNK